MQKGILRKLTSFIALSLLMAFSAKAQTMPEVGRSYYIAAQTWDGSNTRAFMESCGPRNGNIMFIDDRVRPEPAAHPSAQPGQMRAERGDGGKIGTYGDVGMWNDFTAENQKV